jgi:hypothetical protein
VHGSNGVDELVDADIFQQIAGGPGFEESKDVLLAIVSGEDQDRNARGDSLDVPRGLDAIELGHGKIHDDHIGTLLEGHLDGFLAIAGLGNYLQIFLLLQEFPRALAHDGVVFG